MMLVGIAMAAMIVLRRFPRKKNNDDRGEERAGDQVLLHRVHAGLDDGDSSRTRNRSP